MFELNWITISIILGAALILANFIQMIKAYVELRAARKRVARVEAEMKDRQKRVGQ